MEVNPASPHTIEVGPFGSPVAAPVPAASSAPKAQADTFAADDTASVFGGVARNVGHLEFEPTGAYRVVNADAMRAHALSLPPGATMAASADLVQIDEPHGPSAGRVRMQEVMHELGFDDRSARDLVLASELIEKLDPSAFESLIKRLQGISQAFSKPEPRHHEDGVDPRPSNDGKPVDGAQLRYLALELSVSDTWQGEGTSGDDASASMRGRRQALRFERLELSLMRKQSANDGSLTVDVSSSRSRGKAALVDATGSDQDLLKSIGLTDLGANRVDEHRLPVTKADGSTGSVVDVLFTYGQQ